MICPLCKTDTFTRWAEVTPYSIMRCTHCGLGVTSPFPTRLEQEASNTEIYSVEQRIRTYLDRERYYRKRYASAMNNIIKFIAGGRLLDVGCNIGLFLVVARERGYAVEGVELNRACAAYGRDRYQLTIHDRLLESVSFPAETFDVVTLFDVLEHIADVPAFLAEVKRILKKDGLIVIQSPNLDSLMSRWTGSKWSWLTPPDHIYHFTVATLERFVKDAGFIVRWKRSWEPLEDFLGNLVTARLVAGIIGRGLSRAIRMTRFLFVPLLPVQRVWWNKLEGGLVEIYATKAEEAAVNA